MYSHHVSVITVYSHHVSVITVYSHYNDPSDSDKHDNFMDIIKKYLVLQKKMEEIHQDEQIMKPYVES